MKCINMNMLYVLQTRTQIYEFVARNTHKLHMYLYIHMYVIKVFGV